MRVTTAFNRLLRLPGASVIDVCLGGEGVVVVVRLRRLRCPVCGVRLEPVPWARPEAHHTRDLEDVVAWLAQQMAKTPIAGLLRIGWDTVGKIVERVVADHLDDDRLAGLVAIGVDEISYRRGQRYLAREEHSCEKSR